MGRPRKPLTPDDERHGTRNAYVNYRCRCEPCKTASTKYSINYTRNPKQCKNPLTGPDDERHGTIDAYANHKCRCPKCVEANRIYHRQNAIQNILELELNDGLPDDPRHGTFQFYVSHFCRCPRCRAAAAEHRKTLSSREREDMGRAETHNFSVRMPPDVFEQLRGHAIDRGVSINEALTQFVVNTLGGPPPSTSCLFTRVEIQPSSNPCEGSICHAVEYAGPSGRVLSTEPVCHAHEQEALARPAEMGSKSTARLVPLSPPTEKEDTTHE